MIPKRLVDAFIDIIIRIYVPKQGFEIYFSSNGWLSLHHITLFFMLRVHQISSILVYFLVDMSQHIPAYSITGWESTLEVSLSYLS